MPRISYFYGISIYMYFDDHGPPHVHAIYSGMEATYSIGDGSRIVGRLPRRAERLIRSWIRLRRSELQERWREARIGIPIAQVEPLP